VTFKTVGKKLCIICNKEKDGNHNSYCRACRNEYNRQWRKNNAKKVKAYSKFHYHKNIEKNRERTKLWYENNLEKSKARNKAWKENNAERIQETRKAWTEKNREKIAEKNRLWYEKNRERIIEEKKIYRKNNAEKGRGYVRKRRAIRNNNGREPYTEQQVLELYGTNCHICQNPIDLSANRAVGSPGWETALHIDHIIPISKGGPDSLDNVRPAHGKCNMSKSNKILSSAQYELSSAVNRVTMLQRSNISTKPK